MLGVCQHKVGPYPKKGLDVTVANEWPINPRSDGGTDGFIINGDGPDDLEPIERNDVAGLRAEIARLREIVGSVSISSMVGKHGWKSWNEARDGLNAIMEQKP